MSVQYRKLINFSLLLLPLSPFASSVVAQSEHEHGREEVIEEIVVYGRSLGQKGRSFSASQGLVGYADFSTRPIERVGEFVEVVPGMVATQHSGEGKANQYFLRGMNLDHGTDFSAYFLGMPVNMRAHAHGQGYLDLNFLIPEIINTVRFAKGPYYADRGDFSTAGTTSFDLYDRVDSPFLKLESGSDAYLRALGVGSFDTKNGHMLSALEIMRNDGPWTLPANIKKTNFVTQYVGQFRDIEFKGALTVYDNQWQATDQVPKREIVRGAIGRFDYLDPSLGGDSGRINLILGAKKEALEMGIYASRYKLNLFGNFTYFLEDPVNGDAHEQVDRRWIYGGYFDYQKELTDRVEFRIGMDLRDDQIGDVSLYSVQNRTRQKVVRHDEVDWLSLGVFAEVEIALSEKWRGLVGLRGDHYAYKVFSDSSENSGQGSDEKFLPGLGLAYELNDFSELYVNWGKGFHSNDVRGATISVDPVSGESVQPVDVFADQQGAEVGWRIERGSNLLINLAYFWLESDSELLFVGDSGSTEASDASERTGLEVAVFWEFDQNWVLDLTGSMVNSNFVGVGNINDHIPNAHGRVFSLGVSRASALGWNWSVRVRHFGDAALVEDDSIHYPSTTLVNTGIGYEFENWSLGIDLFNVFDAEDYDIAYWYASKLQSESSSVEDIHFHPANPRSLRMNIEYRF